MFWGKAYTMRRSDIRKLALTGMAISLAIVWAACGPEIDDFDEGATAFGAVKRVSNRFVSKSRSQGGVKNRYIVVLTSRPGAVRASTAKRTMTKLASTYRASIKRRYQHALVGFAARMSEASARKLSQDPTVSFVEQDAIVRKAGWQKNPSWGLDRIDQANLPLNNSYQYDETGSGVTAYVLDSGIRITHEEFQGRASYGFDAIGDGQGADDCYGHGTSVAGAIASRAWGVAKRANVVAVRVFDCSGTGSISSVIAGVEWVTANAKAPAVANMSLAASHSASLNAAVEQSISRGILYVVAAANYNANACAYSPASASKALTVGATTSTDRRADYSNYGPCVDLFAPGHGIWTTSFHHDTSKTVGGGTSMAAPHVAGVAALWLQRHPDHSPKQVTSAIQLAAVTGKLEGIGAGSCNRLLSTRFLSKCNIKAGVNQGVINASWSSGQRRPLSRGECMVQARKRFREGRFACGYTTSAGKIAYQEAVWDNEKIHATTCSSGNGGQSSGGSYSRDDRFDLTKRM